MKNKKNKQRMYNNKQQNERKNKGKETHSDRLSYVYNTNRQIFTD